MHTAIFYNRELSWLSFNYRVLMEAKNPDVPLFERVKFLAIYSSNQDEFFRVKVAALRRLADINKKGIKKELDANLDEVLKKINSIVRKQLQEYGNILSNTILPELRSKGVFLYQGEPLLEEHEKLVKQFFKSKLLSYLQPVFLNPKRPPFLENRALYLVVKLYKRSEDSEKKPIYVHINIPSKHLPRFVHLSSEHGMHYYITLDDILRFNLSSIFPGYEVIESYSIKMNRDEDLNIEDEYSGDLVEKIKKQLDKKGKGIPTRFLYDKDMPRYFLKFLTRTFDLKKEDLVTGGRYHNLNDLMKLPNPLKPDLEYPSLPPLEHPAMDSSDSILATIEKDDQILHFPYHSYDNVLRFFNEAAIDPEVESISVTLYRIAQNSFIANALISAAFNGKKVTVFVEVKARFDEENNLYWAQKMEEAGIRIIYSIPGLKVHAKVALVIRKSGDVKTGYAYLGTGNFNESTATIYADHGLFTSNQEIVEELGNVFRYLYKKKVKKDFDHLLVSQFNMKEKFLELIDKEIEVAKTGERSGIIIKLNNLEQKEMIEKLYEASQAGVPVQIIVRGICCLVPEMEGLSENIKVIRIVDRFLEHARVFIFHNNGDEKMFLSSADWMHRNLDRRVEVGFPIYQTNIKAEIKKIVEFQLNDNTKAVCIDQNQKNLQRTNGSEIRIRAQTDTYQWLKNASQEN